VRTRVNMSKHGANRYVTKQMDYHSSINIPQPPKAERGKDSPLKMSKNFRACGASGGPAAPQQVPSGPDLWSGREVAKVILYLATVHNLGLNHVLLGLQKCRHNFFMLSKLLLFILFLVICLYILIYGTVLITNSKPTEPSPVNIVNISS